MGLRTGLCLMAAHGVVGVRARGDELTPMGELAPLSTGISAPEEPEKPEDPSRLKPAGCCCSCFSPSIREST